MLDSVFPLNYSVVLTCCLLAALVVKGRSFRVERFPEVRRPSKTRDGLFSDHLKTIRKNHGDLAAETYYG